jgi:hypothetical protein
VVGATALVLGAVTGCSLFGDDDADGQTISVFDVEPGDCFLAPAEITIELTELRTVDCTDPHEQEAYAVVDYVTPDGSKPGSFPGEAVLKDFADGACIEHFAEYVGVDYRDSDLFFTYLMPSARGWEQGKDRAVTCFITTTGEQMTSSVRGTAV